MIPTPYQLKQRRNDAFRMGELCRQAGQHKRAKKLFDRGKKLRRAQKEALPPELQRNSKGFWQ